VANEFGELTGENKVWGWGDNRYGQVGNHQAAATVILPTGTGFAESYEEHGLRAVSVAAGADHTVAVMRKIDPGAEPEGTEKGLVATMLLQSPASSTLLEETLDMENSPIVPEDETTAEDENTTENEETENEDEGTNVEEPGKNEDDVTNEDGTKNEEEDAAEEEDSGEPSEEESEEEGQEEEKKAEDQKAGLKEDGEIIVKDTSGTIDGLGENKLYQSMKVDYVDAESMEELEKKMQDGHSDSRTSVDVLA